MADSWQGRTRLFVTILTMGNEPSPNSRLRHLPGILAATAALIAALSTLYVNLRGTSPPVQSPEHAAIAPPAAPSSVAPAALVDGPAPEVLVRLDRVLVENDGSLGATDWTFEVSAAGEPRFTLPMRDLNDKPGHNLARPSDPSQAQAELMLAPDQQLQLQVKGWKKGFLVGSGAEISGSAWISGKPGNASIHVAGDKPKSPAFTLYFVVAPRTYSPSQ
jgi:hypothetical protein